MFLIPPAKRVKQNCHCDPDHIHCPQAETEVAQAAGRKISGRKDVLAPLASLIDEQEHGKDMDDIKVKDVEKERNSPEDDHRFGKPVTDPFDQCQENECRTHCHEQKVQRRWIFRRVQEG